MTDNHDPYEPIACGQHSRYELAVMHRVELQLAWRDESGGAHISKVIPTDLITIG
jgi:transcriptional antiterminator Rof (Rho-off)